MSRKINFAIGEYYHIYNRGVDKRAIILDDNDLQRFYLGLDEFNKVKPIDSLYEYSFSHHREMRNSQDDRPLVDIICYAINSNHFHLLLSPRVNNGIEKLLHRLSMGYSKYFNRRYKRNGTLFQGPFKSIHVNSNEYLLHLSAYINLNDQIHQLGHAVSKLDTALSWTSLSEYLSAGNAGFCVKEIILDQFEDSQDYQSFLKEKLPDLIERKKLDHELQILLMED